MRRSILTTIIVISVVFCGLSRLYGETPAATEMNDYIIKGYFEIPSIKYPGIQSTVAPDSMRGAGMFPESFDSMPERPVKQKQSALSRIPEPESLILLAVATTVLIQRWRRRNVGDYR
ncbi:MAG: hypothetical protein AB1454_13555 [Candidatus Auribacterota bacterium]